MLLNERFYNVQLARGKPEIPRHAYRINPEFGREVITIHVNMRRFIRFVAVEIEAVGSAAQNRWHDDEF